MYSLSNLIFDKLSATDKQLGISLKLKILKSKIMEKTKNILLEDMKQTKKPEN